MSEETKKYCYCINKDNLFSGSFQSREEALKEGMTIRKDLKETGVDVPDFVLTGKSIDYIPFFDSENIIENLYVHATDTCGDVADNWLDGITGEEKSSLQAMVDDVITDWLKDNEREPNFYQVVDIVRHSVAISNTE